MSFKVKEMKNLQRAKGSKDVLQVGKYSGTKNSELADAWIRYITGAEAKEGNGLRVLGPYHQDKTLLKRPNHRQIKI